MAARSSHEGGLDLRSTPLIRILQCLALRQRAVETFVLPHARASQVVREVSVEPEPFPDISPVNGSVEVAGVVGVCAGDRVNLCGAVADFPARRGVPRVRRVELRRVPSVDQHMLA